MWLNGWRYEQPEAPVQAPVFVSVHGHCWLDPSHVITTKVIKKERGSEQVWHCKQCDVREKTIPCRKRKCDELVPAS